MDFRYAFRTFRRTPLLAAVVIGSLALGIGANTAIFSLLDQILFRPLPVRHPQELIVLKSPGLRNGRVNSDEQGGASSFSYPMYRDLRDHNEVFSGLLARFAIPASVAFRDQTERAAGELVSGNYFETLGVQPVLGRLFTQEDDRQAGGHPVVILSHGFWQRRFGSDPAILNQPMIVNGHSMTIVGVTPPQFFGVQVGESPDIFVPMMMKAQMTPGWDAIESHNDYWLKILGRLKPGVTRQRAAVSLAPAYRSWMEAEVQTLKLSGDRREKFLKKPLLVEPGAQGRQILRADAEGPLWILMSMVGLVLLIACANVANLLAARGAARQREIAVRLSLGAGRARLVRQLLTESLLLGLAGGAGALLVAYWTLDALLAMLPNIGARGLSANLDWRVMIFNFALASLTGLLFGIFPALQASRPDLAPVLKDQAENVVGGHARAGFRKALLAAQMAFMLLLLAGAGMFTRSLANLRSVDLGIRTDRVVAFAVAPELNGYTGPRMLAFYRQLQTALASLPGVRGSSAAAIALLSDSESSSNFTVESFDSPDRDDLQMSNNYLLPGYFSVMGVPLMAGREFTEQETESSPRVCIINQSAAKFFFKDRSPVGRKIAFGSGTVKPDIEIVGVVKDMKHANVRDAVKRFAFFPFPQQKNPGSLTYYVRTVQDPALLMNAIRGEVKKLDANLPVYDLRTLDAQIDENLFAERFLVMLSGAFGGLAALLAALGVYGVMAYTVARRTREIGIRMALGATAANVRWLVMREVGTTALLGVAVALPAAYGLGRVIQSQLYGVKSSDPWVAILATAGVMLVAAVAGYIPARRASKIEPLVALRYE